MSLRKILAEEGLLKKTSSLNKLLSGAELLALAGTTRQYDLGIVRWVKHHSDTIVSAVPTVKKIPTLDLSTATPREASAAGTLVRKALARVGDMRGVMDKTLKGETARALLGVLRVEEGLLLYWSLSGGVDPDRVKSYEAALAKYKKLGADYIRDNKGRVDETLDIQATHLPAIKKLLKSLGVKRARYDKRYNIIKFYVNKGLPGRFDSTVEIHLSKDHMSIQSLYDRYGRADSAHPTMKVSYDDPGAFAAAVKKAIKQAEDY
jgi:hypothetical protein